MSEQNIVSGSRETEEQQRKVSIHIIGELAKSIERRETWLNMHHSSVIVEDAAQALLTPERKESPTN